MLALFAGKAWEGAFRGVNFTHQLGALKDKRDDRDLLLSTYLTPRKLPKVLTWGDWKIPAKNQGGYPACVGFSCASMKETQEKIESGKLCIFDGLSLYNECKKVDGIPNQEGTYIRVALKILQNTGAQLGGRFYKVASYTRVETVDELRFALASSGPVVAGVPVYDSWNNPNMRIDLPKEGEPSRGGHAILITGYDDNRGVFYVKNSWGSGWGMGGRIHLSYDYIDKLLYDAWAVVDFEDKVAQTYLRTDKIARDIEKVTS